MNAMVDVRYFPQDQYEQVETRFDTELGVLWGMMNPKPRPTFNLQLLADLHSYVRSITESGGNVWSKGRLYPIQYAVITSNVPGVFNLGGDLALFREAIKARNRDLLVEYGRREVVPGFRTRL